MTAPLFDRVAELVDAARTNAVGTPAAEPIHDIATRLREPLRVAIAGRAKAGKSTLLNALAGEVLAPTDAGECTRTVTWYREGISYRATLTAIGRHAQPTSLHRTVAGIEVDLLGLRAEQIQRIEVEWPTTALRTMTLIDTPGIGSISGIGGRTTEFLAPDDDRPTDADAVIYLTRHVHSGDVRFLEAFHDGTASRSTPANAVAVLSRADEVGGGRADSLISAAGIAARYRGQPALRRYCSTVVPVAGLLAQAATSFTEGEYRALGRLAELDDDRAEWLLASADRFVDRDTIVTGLIAEERAHLMRRLGVFGVRLGRDLLLRGHATSARNLGVELRQRSGLDDLRNVLATSFTSRSQLFKARSALVALGDTFQRYELPQGDRMSAALEQIVAGAHELAELRVLTAIRSGVVKLTESESVEAERLLGPGTPAARLGIPDAGQPQQREAALIGIARWRGRGESPLSNPAVVEASQVITRALEWIAMSGSRR